MHLITDNDATGAGLLEYLNTSGWVPVCFTEAFTEHAADVTCRQFGYPFATNIRSVVLPYDRPGIGITASFCEETNNFRGYLFYCVHYESTICQMQLHLTCYNSKYMSSHVYIIITLNINLGSNTVRLIGSPVEHMGRVEVFDKTSHQWGTICTNDISDQYDLARIICRSLGYFSYQTFGRASNYSNIALSSNSPIITGHFQCAYTSSNSYQNLYQCLNFESNLGIAPSQCTSDQEWVVVCSRKFLNTVCCNFII